MKLNKYHFGLFLLLGFLLLLTVGVVLGSEPVDPICGMISGCEGGEPDIITNFISSVKTLF